MAENKTTNEIKPFYTVGALYRIRTCAAVPCVWFASIKRDDESVALRIQQEFCKSDEKFEYEWIAPIMLLSAE